MQIFSSRIAQVKKKTELHACPKYFFDLGPHYKK